MKPTFLRWVAIAALMAGGTFSVAANPPAAPPVSYGVEEDVFHPVRATHGMVASVDIITGTSAGSFVGALYAAGYSGFQLQRIAQAVGLDLGKDAGQCFFRWRIGHRGCEG